MSASMRLALVLVIITLGATLALLVGGDAPDWGAAAARFAAQLRSALATAPVPAAHEDPVAKQSPPVPTASVSERPHEPPAEEFARQSTPPARSEPDRSSASTSSSRAQQVPAEIKPAPTYVSDRPTKSKSASGSIRLAAASEFEGDRATTSGDPKIDELYIRNQDITAVLELLSKQGHRNIIASRNVKGPLTVTLYDTTVDDALAAILKMQGLVARQEGDYLRVYTPEDLEDAELQTGRIEVRIYKPRYISAADLLGILTPHLSKQGRISSTKPNQIGIAANADNAGGDGLAVEDALVVQDAESVLKRIERIIESVDVRPPQVLIEATVLKVELSDSNQMGVNFAAFGNGGRKGQTLTLSGQGSLIDGAAGFTPSFLVDGVGKLRDGFVDGEHGLKFGVTGGDLTAFIKLLETVGHTTLVASPKVLALNKQRAEIIVGQQLGYRTVTTTETAAVENIQFLEVGTQLRLRPFVQPDGMIRLEIHPEKSSGQINADTQLPEKQTTQVTTNMTVPNGTTIVIGGLIEEQQERQVKQVPFLGSLRWIGPLFRDETTSTRRQEIIVLITPRIVDESAWDCEARRELDVFEARRDTLERSFPAYTRIALARKYYEKACHYREHGDVKTARKMADCAVHFDPTGAAAIQLRDELASASSGDSITHAPAIESSSAAPASSVPPTPVPATARKDRRERLLR